MSRCCVCGRNQEEKEMVKKAEGKELIKAAELAVLMWAMPVL